MISIPQAFFSLRNIAGIRSTRNVHSCWVNYSGAKGADVSIFINDSDQAIAKDRLMLPTDKDWKSRILIADDQIIFRKRIKRIISETTDMTVIDDVSQKKEALRTISREDPDMLIMDIAIQDGNGLETLREIKEIKPGLPILILSLYPEEQYPAKILKEAGATGYVAKETVSSELLQAVRHILQGGMYFAAEKSVIGSGIGGHL
jgi:CheY-like chemotaxis protein